MKCDNIPLLWKKIFLNIANNRDYVNIYCSRPLNSFDQRCSEWFLHNLIKNNTVINSSNNLDELPEYSISWEWFVFHSRDIQQVVVKKRIFSDS